MSPTKSIPSPVLPRIARRSLITLTSHTLLAPTSSTSWHSTPPTLKTRKTCAKWPPPLLRARSVMPRIVVSVVLKEVSSVDVFLTASAPFVTFTQALYHSWVLDACRNILAVLEDMPSLQPPIDHLCELLPRLQARYYSIASSSKVNVYLNSICVLFFFLNPNILHLILDILNLNIVTRTLSFLECI